MQEQHLVCLNPQCQLERKITCYNNHYGCQDWIVSYQKLKGNQYIFENQVYGVLNVDFGCNGLMPLFEILNMGDWSQQMQGIYEDMKSVICTQIQRQKKDRIKQFKQLYQKANKGYQQVCNNVFRIVQCEFKNGPLPIKCLLELKNQRVLSINHFQRANVYFEKVVMPVVRNLCSFTQSRGEYQLDIEQFNRLQASKKAIKDLIQESEISEHERLQKLSSILGKNIVKAHYDPQMDAYKSYCWICNSICTSKRGQTTKQKSFHKLFKHLMIRHKEVVMDTYMKKVLKFNIFQISFHNFLNQLQCEKFDEVVVVDRQNAGSLEKPEALDFRSVWIEVVNKGNKNLAKGQFIVAQSNQRDAADLMMTSLIFEIAKNSQSKIILITKDHFGETLKQLVVNIFNIKMIVMQPKQFQYRFG